MIYRAPYIKAPDVSVSFWVEPAWKHFTPACIDQYMGQRPDHFPNAQVKLAYDQDALFLMFRIEDQYILAKSRQDQDAVYKDSCVEFFFVPGKDSSVGYFNLEMNCGGTMLFHFQKQPRQDITRISKKDCSAVQRSHTLEKIIDPEIREAMTWSLAYRVPISLLRQYCQVEQPAPDVIWRANFYKCADESSHPHWLTWAKVDSPVPDFHRPDSFGEIRFT